MLVLCGAAAAETGWGDESVALLRKNGMTVLAPSEELSADLQKVGQTMLQEWLQRAGTDGRVMYEAYQKP